jgi:hypothetical protein
MGIWIEVLLYFIYIFQIIIIAIFIKPTRFILLLVGLYTFITTSMIYYYGKCKKFNNIKYFTITLYSFFCMFAYFMIHRIYYFYPSYRFILIILPVVYIATIKLFEHVVKCENNSVINFGIQMFLTLIKK